MCVCPISVLRAVKQRRVINFLKGISFTFFTVLDVIKVACLTYNLQFLLACYSCVLSSPTLAARVKVLKISYKIDNFFPPLSLENLLGQN